MKELKKHKESCYLVSHMCRRRLCRYIVGAHLSGDVRRHGTRGVSELLFKLWRQEREDLAQEIPLGVELGLQLVNLLILLANRLALTCPPPAAFAVHVFDLGVTRGVRPQPTRMVGRPDRGRQHVVLSVCLELSGSLGLLQSHLI